jgi:hypothetical protein
MGIENKATTQPEVKQPQSARLPPRPDPFATPESSPASRTDDYIQPPKR